MSFDVYLVKSRYNDFSDNAHKGVKTSTFFIDIFHLISTIENQITNVVEICRRAGLEYGRYGVKRNQSINRRDFAAIHD